MESAIAEHLSHVPVFVRTMDGVITYWSNGAEELYGFSWDQAVGRISHDLLRTTFPVPQPEIERTLGEAGRWQGLLQHVRADGDPLWVQANWRLRKAPGQEVVVETCTDVTHREMLSRELAHRIKNMLSIVQSLARFSYADADRESTTRFEARLKALSDATDLLVRGRWEGAELCEMLTDITRRFGVEQRFKLSGPRVRLNPNSVIGYGLAFHELMTNAIKYGALSTPEGRVEVGWRVIEEVQRSIHLIWAEHGGPPVAPPQARGFGSRLIERAVAAELGTPVKLHFPPSGLVCEVDGPLEKTPWSTVQVEAALEAEDLPDETKAAKP